MPYITTEEVRDIRNGLKKEMPEFKFSVRKNDNMEVSITFMKGPVEFPEDFMGINHFWYKRNYEDSPEIVEAIDRVMNVLEKVKPNKTVVEDMDYGSIPNYYIDIGVGKFEKRYIQT